MNTQRKLQLCAAAVIANGLMALGAMTPTAALAVACSDNNFGVCNELCLTTCPPVSGCTVTKICLPPPVCDVTGTYCSYS
jgi:hypothetical protein